MLVPSRGRPSAVAELLASLPPDPNVDVEICVDHDDPLKSEYWSATNLARARTGVQSRLMVLAATPRRLAGCLDQAALLVPQYGPDYTHIGFCGDDHRPRTPNWATLLMQAADQSQPGVAYGDDRVHGRALPTAVVLDSRIPAALNRFTFPNSQHLYLDNYWRDLGLELGTLSYVPEVTIEHLHPIRRDLDLPWDEGHLYASSPDLFEKDSQAYARFVDTGGLQLDAQIVRDYVQRNPR